MQLFFFSCFVSQAGSRVHADQLLFGRMLFLFYSIKTEVFIPLMLLSFDTEAVLAVPRAVIMNGHVSSNDAH